MNTKLAYGIIIVMLTGCAGWAASGSALDERNEEYRLQELYEKSSRFGKLEAIASEKEASKRLMLAMGEFLFVTKAAAELSRVTYDGGDYSGSGKIVVGGAILSLPGSEARDAERIKRAERNAENARKLEILTEMKGTLLKIAVGSLESMDPLLRKQSAAVLSVIQQTAAGFYDAKR